jgi:hypothetical protein
MAANAAPSAPPSADAGVHWRRVRGGQPTVRRRRSALRTDAFGPPISRVRSLLAEMLAKLFGEFTDRGQASSQATGYET